jgi:hypothetical protein
VATSHAYPPIPLAWVRKLNSVEKKQEVTSLTSVACVSMKPGISLPVTNFEGANDFQWEIKDIKDCTAAICVCLVVFEFRSVPR